jgi:hypothetical protein
LTFSLNLTGACAIGQVNCLLPQLLEPFFHFGAAGRRGIERQEAS